MSNNLIGQTLGEYRLEQIIGEGGMSTVYKAFQESLNRWVAVKVLYYQEETSLERFRREAKAVAGLRHRNILIIYEFGDETEHPFIAMEYIEGGTLEDRLSVQPMPWQRVIELVIPVAEALYYAHQNGIIHRDVKPSNILMPQDDWPVLADFGLVKRSDEEKSLTLSGTFVGTPTYIAPEQVRDSELDYRVDMYTLGVIMFEMITGQLPFDDENPNKVLLAHVKDAPPQPRDLNPDCPPALEAIILRMLEKTPADRFADMGQVIGRLKDLLENPQAATISPDAATGPLPKAKSAEPQEVPEEKSEGVGGFFKKLFGRGSKPAEKEEQDPSKTAPREQLAADDDEDEDDQTLQLTLGASDSSETALPGLIVVDKNTTIMFPDKKGSLIVGRTHGGSRADIDLEPYEASKYGVSRRHARFLPRNNRWQIEDLNSLNGTFVNDKPVRHGRPVELKDGDRIRISQMKLVFLSPSES